MSKYIDKTTEDMRFSPIREFILNNLTEHQKDIVKTVIRKFGLSRQAVLRHMYVLIQGGRVTAHGKTKDRYYELNPIVNRTVTITITPKLEEDKIGRKYLFPHLSDFSSNLREICEYGFMEIVNNVISHSEGDQCTLKLNITAKNVHMYVHDNGVGIFRKIKEHFDLENQHHAILELSKGRLTTNPKTHIGDGIFSIIHLFDKVQINSGGLCWKYDISKGHQVVESGSDQGGTSVSINIATSSKNRLQNVFNKYSTEIKTSLFDRTEVPVILGKFDSENFMSRSQARRLSRNLEKFHEVCIDFKGIKLIGDSFADEIFRVFQNQHPDLKIDCINTNVQIENLVSGVKNNGNSYIL